MTVEVPSTRVATVHDRWLAWSRDRFGWLLALLVANYIILMILPGEGIPGLIGAFAVGITALFALDCSAAPRRLRIVARTMVAVIPILPVLYLIGLHSLRASIPLSMAAMLAVTTFVVLRHLLGHEKVDSATLLAAIDTYVLIGLVFAEMFYAFSLMSLASPFLAQASVPERSDLVYLSYVTLTTVGFGDLTPLSKVARTLVITEALFGQVFLVTAVARIVSLFGQDRRGTPAQDAGVAEEPKTS